jgi:hypothetical protein
MNAWNLKHPINVLINETNQHPSQYIQNILIMTNLVIKFKEFPKITIKTDGWNHHMGDKNEGQSKGQQMHNPKESKKGES